MTTIFAEYMVSTSIGCCTHRTGKLEGGFHRSCTAGDVGGFRGCRAQCDRDKQCKGFEFETTCDDTGLGARCFVFTTGECGIGSGIESKNWELKDSNNENQLLVDGNCGRRIEINTGPYSVATSWCFIKKRGNK